MKASYYFYKGKIQSLPKSVFFLVILLIILLVPLIVFLLIVAGTASLLVHKILRYLIPGKKKKSETIYSDYEIVEAAQEEKKLFNS